MSVDIEEDDLAACDKGIYENGEAVAIAHGATAVLIEQFVRAVAKHSQQPVDWFYAGGRAVIKTTGDVQRVRGSLESLQLHLRIVD